MAKKKLTTLYKEILESMGFEIDTHGRVFFEEAGVKVPMTIKKKHLVLPTDEWLKDPDWEKEIPFHPLSENTQRKKSIVLEKLTMYAANRIYQVGATLIHFLFTLAENTDAHKKLSPEQRDILRLIPNCDTRLISDIQKLVRGKMGPTGETAFANFFIRRGGLYKGEEYPRVAVVSFPVMDFEDSEDKKVFDVTFRVKDRQMLFAVLRHILPGIDKPLDSYSYGSRSSIAPNFHSLLMAFINVTIDLNKIIRLFKDDFEEEMTPIFSSTKWLKDIDSFKEWRDEIPPLDGNIGDPNEDELKKVQEKAQRKVERNERRENARDVASGRRSVLQEEDGRRGPRTEDDRIDLLGRRDSRDFGRREEREVFSLLDRRDDRRSRWDDDRSSRRGFSDRGRDRDEPLDLLGGRGRGRGRWD